MVNLPLVSVGITTYNRPDGLSRTLSCITKQSYQNLDIIVSDNCSTGLETQKVVQRHASNDPRIRYFRQSENKGVGYNFKFVLEASVGEYFMWASDDDNWELEFVEEGLNCLSNSSRSAWISNVSVMNNHCQITRHFPYFERFVWPEKKLFHIVRFLWEPECLGKPSVIHSLFRKEHLLEVLEHYDFTKKSLAASDICFNLAFLVKYNLATTNKTLFYKNDGSDRKTTNPTPLKQPYLHIFRLKNSLAYIKEIYLATRGSGYCFVSVLVMILRIPLAIINELYFLSKTIIPRRKVI